MEDQGQSMEGVIHFECNHCQISLTVDDALAGISGPCPSCGETIAAPELHEPEKKDVQPGPSRANSPSTSDLPSSEPASVARESRPASLPSGSPSASDSRSSKSSSVANEARSRDKSTGGRSIRPDSALSEPHRERAEVATVAKMLISGLVVLGIVLAVAWWLKSRMGA